MKVRSWEKSCLNRVTSRGKHNLSKPIKTKRPNLHTNTSTKPPGQKCSTEHTGNLIKQCGSDGLCLAGSASRMYRDFAKAWVALTASLWFLVATSLLDETSIWQFYDIFGIFWCDTNPCKMKHSLGELVRSWNKQKTRREKCMPSSGFS